MVGGGHIVWKAPQCVSHKKMSSVLSGILCAINTRSMILPKKIKQQNSFGFWRFWTVFMYSNLIFSLPVSFGIHVKYGTFCLFKAVFDKATYQFKIYHNVSKSSSHHFVSIKASARGVIVNRPLRPLTSVLRHLFPHLCIFICTWWPLMFPKPFLAFLYTCPRNPPRTFDMELVHTLEPEGAIYIKLYLQTSSNKERKVLRI